LSFKLLILNKFFSV